MWNKYYNVASINEAVELLAHYQEKARIIAGGTDILIELERHQRPDVDILIDITRVPGWNNIEIDDRIHLGPLVTHNQVVAHPELVRRALPLAQACWEVGAPQIRNRATIAGNLITASPANDTITPLMALDTEVELVSTSARRTVPLDKFYTGVRQTIMQPDELMSKISFRPLAANERGIFLKLGLRQAQAISVVNVALVLGFDDNTVASCVMTMGSVAPTIIHARRAEVYLVGKTLTEDTIREAATKAAEEITPINDVRGSAVYRTEMIKMMVVRGLRALANNQQAVNWPESPPMLAANITKEQDQTIEFPHDMPIHTEVNGKSYVVPDGQNKSLLRFLRENLGLTGTKEGCAEGECGACTIFLDGDAVMSCLVSAPRAHNASIVTIEGLAQDGNLHPIQQAFIDKGAVQCGYCTPGLLMVGAKLLEEQPQPSKDQIVQSISGNLCRCTGYYKIIEAFLNARKGV